ncbi:Large-conductance mechanosensitive channel [anaerobic digester metagenome]
MKILNEFKTFALKGNVTDMAIGIIIGAAFGKIVTSLVNDIIMPPLGLLIGGVNFTDLKLVMKAATETTPAVTWNFGSFIQVVFDFLIVAMAIFMLVKTMNAAKRKEEAKPAEPAAPPAPTKEEVLLTEIRDILKKQ